MLRSAILSAVLIRCCLHRQYVAGLGWALEKPGFSSAVLVAAEGSWTHWELGLAVPLLHQMELLYHGSQPDLKKKRDCCIREQCTGVFPICPSVYHFTVTPNCQFAIVLAPQKDILNKKPNPTTVILLLTWEVKNSYLFFHFQISNMVWSYQ